MAFFSVGLSEESENNFLTVHLAITSSLSLYAFSLLRSVVMRVIVITLVLLSMCFL